ncbi:unnamed protein product [Angiostrongylus costaricensis]|uniref:CRIM domain-containing protein n=1 Tax=Angiostrongylus costaricensis TaxID=334426 RepID=A0A0R3PG46_ANGCS|nr:unnamed protein product [Angiostrongylus costaricensis]
MAFFDEQELIDRIRHELRIEDDSGTCSRVVAPEPFQVFEVCKSSTDFMSAFRFLKENSASVENPLLGYAKFEAVGKQASKTILILYNAKEYLIVEVIGYCLYRIFADSGNPLSGNVDDYQLLMADDGGEVETDLPPLDRSRSIGDLGFTVLALVSKAKSTSGGTKPTYRVIVYVLDFYC